tara:strand:+ start:7951 stop:8232 length:282 start_codon:yes stop_codon:yes gene_type:complete
MKAGDVIMYRWNGSRQMGLIMDCRQIECGPIGPRRERQSLMCALIHWFENDGGVFPEAFNEQGMRVLREDRQLNWVPIQRRPGINVIDVVAPG